ncbi:carboxypeptidase regulatory-like domain-containing protein [bacterium]|nr:MAG: carboxypeptidase regulatory-like domain-containing protein [bacterium]
MHEFSKLSIKMTNFKQKRGRMKLINFFLIFILVLSACNEESKPISNISGKVITAVGDSAIVNVLIATNPPTGSVFTDSNGNYLIPEVSEGPYTVGASKNGFVTTTVDVLVKRGQTISANILMTRTIVADNGNCLDPILADFNWSEQFRVKGLSSDVYGIASKGSDVYVGGRFDYAGSSLVSFAAKWNGANWSALGSGMNEAVFPIVVIGNDVYYGGVFTTAGGVTVNHVARWDGNSWHALGSGTDGNVYAMAVLNGDLYIGGSFTQAGGVPANNIAKWNGSQWSAVGTGTNDVIYSMAIAGTDVIVGGNFTVAGGTSANRIAKWNGSAWSALGSGMNNYVRALAVNNSTIYAGGIFTTAGGNTAYRLAQWDGNSWSSLGDGANEYVVSLLFYDNILYCGGWFTMLGTKPINYIAQWDGNEWCGLGSGVGGYGSLGFPPGVNAMAINGSELYVGGQFDSAGTKPSSRISSYLIP